MKWKEQNIEFVWYKLCNCDKPKQLNCDSLNRFKATKQNTLCHYRRMKQASESVSLQIDKKTMIKCLGNHYLSSVYHSTVLV